MIRLKNGNWVVAESWDRYRNRIEALECGYEIDPDTGEWVKVELEDEGDCAENSA